MSSISDAIGLADKHHTTSGEHMSEVGEQEKRIPTIEEIKKISIEAFLYSEKVLK